MDAQIMYNFASTLIIATIILTLIMAVPIIIARYKIFKKAGKKGIFSIIPIYSDILYCKIVGINPLFLLLILLAFIPTYSDTIFTILTYVYSIITSIFLGRRFSKSPWFIIGLVFLPFIFMLILAFDKSKYTKKAI